MNLPVFMKKNLDIYLRNYLKQKASTCKVCNGSLIIEGEDDVKNCPECIDKTVPHRKLIYANIGMDYLNIELADVREVFDKDCTEGLAELCENITEVMSKMNIFIHRHSDSHSYGTSTAGMILLKELIRRELECFVVSCSSLVDYFYGFGDKSPDVQKKEMLEYVQAIPVLFIDNLGSEFKKFMDKEFLHTSFINFLGKRKLNGKMTILSTEMTTAEFKAMYPGALTNHITQYYLPIYIRCHTGKSKHTAEARFKDNLKKKMPMLSKYLDAEGPKHKPKPTPLPDTPKEEPPKKSSNKIETSMDTDVKDSNPKFMGSRYRGK